MQLNNLKCSATSDLEVSIPDDSKIIILYFYPKDATPGCTVEGQDFRDNYAEFLANNSIVYGVSRDSLKSHEKFKEKQKFPFELISDEDEELCKTFNVLGEKSMFGKKYMGIIRSTFVITPDGKVIKEWKDVKVTGHVAEVLDFIKSL